MRNSLLAAVAILGLTACDRSPAVDERNATPAEVANAVSKAGIDNDIYLRTGEWRVASRIEHMDLPGLPPSEQSKMKERGNSTHQYCLTPEEAKRPGGKFFDRQAEKNCRYEHFSMGGGKIDAVMRCGAPAGAFMMTIAGTYSEDSYSTQVAMDMEGGREGKMTMKTRSEAHRIGECTAEDEARAKEQSETKG